MERLASDELSQQYDVPALKTLALNHIRSELGKCDIAEEAFSRFASRCAGYATKVGYMLTERHRYDEIRNLYIAQLAHVWMEDSTTEATRVSVDKKIDDFVKGDLEHAAESVSALLEIANKTGDIAAPSNTSPTVSSFRFFLPNVVSSCLLHIIRPFRLQAPPTGRLSRPRL